MNSKDIRAALGRANKPFSIDEKGCSVLLIPLITDIGREYRNISERAELKEGESMAAHIVLDLMTLLEFNGCSVDWKEIPYIDFEKETWSGLLASTGRDSQAILDCLSWMKVVWPWNLEPVIQREFDAIFQDVGTALTWLLRLMRQVITHE